MAEAEAERRVCFDKAWAQKRAREEAENRGSVFVPEWEHKQIAAAKSATDALMAAALAKADKEKQAGEQRAKVVKQKLMQADLHARPSVAFPHTAVSVPPHTSKTAKAALKHKRVYEEELEGMDGRAYGSTGGAGHGHGGPGL